MYLFKKLCNVYNIIVFLVVINFVYSFSKVGKIGPIGSLIGSGSLENSSATYRNAMFSNRGPT